ncbi:MAG: pilus assembly protein [Hyphomonadaceae bacterium]|nr:pilus assembly protein [Hyphomonadaceae bacterium]
MRTSTISRAARKIATTRKGTAAVEFALLAPVFLLLCFIMAGYGLLFMTQVSLHQLSADLTRSALGGLTLAEKQERASAHLSDRIDSFMMLDSQQARVRVFYDDATQETEVVLEYDTDTHPVRVLEGLLPMPPQTLEIRSSITGYM